MTRVLFVCTGNICRSPMAEVICRDYAARRGRAVEVRSASLLGLDGRPAEPNAIEACEEIGLDLRAHRAQPVTPELMAWAEHVLVMEFAQAAKLRERYPEATAQISLLGPYGGALEIEDPMGGWMRRFRASRDEIRRCVQAFVDRLPAQP